MNGTYDVGLILLKDSLVDLSCLSELSYCLQLHSLKAADTR